MYIGILGRQSELGLAELERVFGNARRFSPETALLDSSLKPDVEHLGSVMKVGQIIEILPPKSNNSDWKTVSFKLVRLFTQRLKNQSGKITLGISVYGFNQISPKDVQKTGLVLKSKLGSLRLIPNTDLTLSTATTHHNKLGLSSSKIEILVVRGSDGSVAVAESLGSQNITALAKRDQGRPKRDAFVGMLPPKLAITMINLAAGSELSRQALDSSKTHDDSFAPRLLDPFCGTGVLLQEASLLGYKIYGTDLAEKMIRYSESNLDWLSQEIVRHPIDYSLEVGDATNHKWQAPINVIAAETYLGQPFSAPPSPAKLTEVMRTCDGIISDFLRNLGSQVKPGTPACLAIPAWRDKNGDFSHLPLVGQLGKLGWNRLGLSSTNIDNLLYYREDQVVARELLILTKI